MKYLAVPQIGLMKAVEAIKPFRGTMKKCENKHL